MDALGAAANAVFAAAPVKRKKRSAAERLRIVEETLLPGASVARVARSHGINANQVFAWRKLHLAGKLAGRKPAAEMSASRLLPVTVSETATPLIAEASTAPAAIPHVPQSSTSSIHIQLPKAQVRVEGGVDPQVLRAVLECLLR
jgi:transposase